MIPAWTRRAGARRMVLAAAALALTIWVIGFASRGLLSGDSGVKLAQAHALWDGGFASRALPYDRQLDPKERFFPYGEFKRKVDQRWQGIYSLSFTAAAAPLVGVFGLTGTLLLGLAGGVLILLAVDLLAGRMGASPPARVAAALVTVGLTPILLYSAQFTEHTPAIGLTILALALVIAPPHGDRVRPLLAGVLVGVAATLRAECYLAVATIGLALSARPDIPLGARVREGALYVAGALAVLLPYWGLNLLLSDTWDPVVTFQKAAPDRWANVKKLLIGDTRGSPLLWLPLLCAAVVAGAALPRRLACGRGGVVLRVVVGLALVWLAWTLSRVATGRTLIGTFSLTPIAAYGLVASAWQPRWRQVWLFGVLTTVAIVALNKSNDAGGLQLGARLVLPAVPALIALAAAALDADLRAARPLPWRIAPAVAPAVLLVFTALMLARGLPPAYQIAVDSDAAARAVMAAPGRPVITKVWWHSQVLTPALLRDKQIYLTGKDVRPVLQALADHGVTEVVIVDHDVTEFALNGYRARSRQSWRTRFGAKNWFEIHDVIIEPR